MDHLTRSAPLRLSRDPNVEGMKEKALEMVAGVHHYEEPFTEEPQLKELEATPPLTAKYHGITRSAKPAKNDKKCSKKSPKQSPVLLPVAVRPTVLMPFVANHVQLCAFKMIAL